MDTAERTTEEKCLTVEQWKDSQCNEAGFWKSQKTINNQDQLQRNTYYRGLLEDGNSIAKEFFEQDFSDSIIADIGSGPEGILHVIKAKCKIAIDPLMDEYRKQGYDVDAHNVIARCCPAEHLYSGDITTTWIWQFDYVVCLNALDHMRNPELAISNIAMCQIVGGELLLITDLRRLEQLDIYHKLSMAEEDVLSWLNPYYKILQKSNFPHQAGNPIRQLIVRCKKK